MTININSVTVLKDLEHICELALMGTDLRETTWRQRIIHYRMAFRDMIAEIERREKE